MNWEKFEKFFHESWHEKMKVFIESEDCDKIYKFLKFESARGKKIAPKSENVYKAFLETDLNQLKVVVLGFCPYHTFYYRKPIADGLLMGCTMTNKLQPSLEQFYNALEFEFYDGVNVKYDKTPDVKYLANQGVLMLNAALTTEMNKPGSHLEIWQSFMKFLFEEIINITGVPVVYLGKEAAKCRRYRGIFSHDFFISHPASASYNHTDWSSEGVFKKVNILIEQNNGEEFKIEWLKLKKDDNSN